MEGFWWAACAAHHLGTSQVGRFQMAPKSIERGGSALAWSGPARPWVLRRLAGAGAVGALVVAGFSLTDCGPTQACNAEPCAEGQQRVCVDQCVTPVAANQPCSFDSCHPQGTCGTGLACFPLPVFGSDLPGRCLTNSFGGLAQTCAPADDPNLPYTDLCANETYCRPGLCVGSGESRCSNPVRLGGACDSNLDDPKCRACEPGTFCIAGVCTRSCEEVSDCPCGAQARCGTIPGTTGGNFCSECRGQGQSCSPYSQCCDPTTQCGPTRTSAAACCRTDGQGCQDKSECCGTSVCTANASGGKVCQECREKGAQCTNDSQCCDGTSCESGICAIPCAKGQECKTPAGSECARGKIVCEADGDATCESLAGKGESCSNDSECCDGLSCKNGVCKLPCVQNQVCTVPRAQGECSKGKIQCDPTTGDATCKGPSPTKETCDGKDNDCDGDEDNIEPVACEGTPTGCQSGFKAKGTAYCNGTKVGCKFVEHGGYCNSCDEKNGVNCGLCQATPCAKQGGGISACTPNYACTGSAGDEECRKIPGCLEQPACWLPSDVKATSECYGGGKP